MKRKMFNFTAPWAVICIVAYALMLSLFIYAAIDWADNTLPVIVTVLIAISLLMLIWFYVIMSPTLEDDRIRQGAKSIAKNNIRVKAEYVKRFQETELIIKDKTVCYNDLPRSQQEKHAVIIQATRRNVRMLEEWLSITITIPPKPKRQSALKLFRR